MEILSISNVSFTYAGSSLASLKNVDLSVKKGDFIVLCGESGSGKSTLLRLLKREIAPHGNKQGTLMYKGKELEEYAALYIAKEIGMVFQDPDNQMVMHNVLEELLFGLENVGFSTADMRKKVAEIVHFFGLNHLLEKKTSELSGGEKQLINLAAVLLLNPTVLLLDEPTAQLDPIAARELIHMVQQLNDEFGITVIMVEHRLEELFTIANRVIVLEKGQVVMSDKPRVIARKLITNEMMSGFLPRSALLYLKYTQTVETEDIPLSVKEAKKWLDQQVISDKKLPEKKSVTKPMLALKQLDYQYHKSDLPVLQNLSLTINHQELLAIVGANGTGKTTLLKIIAGILKPQHGHITYHGKRVKNIDPALISYLPQNPKMYFLMDSIHEEYQYIAEIHHLENTEKRINDMLEKFRLSDLQDRHPYDLSGGELQKAALMGTLLVNPSILLIDEPTKGLDPESKRQLGEMILQLVEDGLTVIMVTHDVEFAAKYATRCSMLFQGEITITEDAKEFFHGNAYYTTVMNRITRSSHVPPVITLEEAIQTWHVQNGS